MWGCVSLCAPHACRCPQRLDGIPSFGSRITGSCEPRNTGPGNGNQVTAKSSDQAISLVPLFIFETGFFTEPKSYGFWQTG